MKSSWPSLSAKFYLLETSDLVSKFKVYIWSKILCPDINITEYQFQDLENVVGFQIEIHIKTYWNIYSWCEFPPIIPLLFLEGPIDFESCAPPAGSGCGQVSEWIPGGRREETETKIREQSNSSVRLRQHQMSSDGRTLTFAVYSALFFPSFGAHSRAVTTEHEKQGNSGIL